MRDTTAAKTQPGGQGKLGEDKLATVDPVRVCYGLRRSGDANFAADGKCVYPILEVPLLLGQGFASAADMHQAFVLG